MIPDLGTPVDPWEYIAHLFAGVDFEDLAEATKPPLKPYKRTWDCPACEVRWTSIDSICWCCGIDCAGRPVIPSPYSA